MMRGWTSVYRMIYPLASAIVVGCSGTPTIEAPPIAHFPQRGYQLHVRNTPEVVHRLLSQKLDEMTVPYLYEYRGSTRYLVSTYMTESDAPGFLKDGRSAVLIIMRPDLVYPGCTELDLRWMYESKGIFGSEWALKGNGPTHAPTLVEVVRDYGEQRSCTAMVESGV